MEYGVELTKEDLAYMSMNLVHTPTGIEEVLAVSTLLTSDSVRQYIPEHLDLYLDLLSSHGYTIND